MKVTQILALAASALLLQGCVSFGMGPERSFPNSEQTSQVQVRKVSEYLPVITPTGFESLYKLELVAVGDFVLHHGHSMKRGTPRLALGLFPGCAEEENMNVGVKAFLSVFCNFSLVGIPTLSSLVFEPFRDYRDRACGDVGDFGLIGFNKYYTNVRKDTTASFATDSKESLSRYRLYGFSVVIDGQRYEDKDTGQGCQSAVYFRSTRPRGSRIKIRIVDPPSVRGDSNDNFDDAQGTELIGVIP